MKIYISGPMAGYPEHNIPAFLKAEERLKHNDPEIVILNPGRKIQSKEITPAECMDIDLAMIRASDAIYMLEGWKSSKGAKVEYYYAVYLGLNIFYG